MQFTFQKQHNFQIKTHTKLLHKMLNKHENATIFPILEVLDARKMKRCFNRVLLLAKIRENVAFI